MALDMAQRATAASKEQRIGGNTLPASKDSEDEGRNTSSEVAYKNIGSWRDSDLAPPDLEASKESKTPLNPQTAQDGLDTGQGEDDGARVIQQAKVHDLSLEKDNFDSEQSLEAVAKFDVQSGIDQLLRVFEENRAKSQCEIDDFTRELHDGKTQSQWIFHRVRRSIVDVIIARATATCMLEDYKAMESHVLNAVEMASVLSQTSLYASLLKRCQYLRGIALYYQQRFQDANDAFEKADNCPAAPGISLRTAKEWKLVIKDALQASRTNSFSEQRENVAHPEAPSAQETQTAPPSPFQSRKLSNITEEVEAGNSNKSPANGTGDSPLEQALPSPGNSPLIPINNPWMIMPDQSQRRVSFNEPTSARLRLRRSASIRSAFAYAGRSRAMSDASMKEDDINAAFGGGGEYQSLTNTPTSAWNPRASWGSAYEREEITLGDESCKQQWAAWESMKRDEDKLFKRDEIGFKFMMKMKYEERRKEAGGEQDERSRDRAREKFWSDRGATMSEDARKFEERKKRRRGKQFKRGPS